MIELLPWAMFANGPQWTKAGPPSRVWSRFGLMRVAQEDGHRAGDLEVLGRDRRPSRRRREDDPAEPRAQVVEVGRERQDGHHLRRDGDDELGLARHAVLAAAEADDDVAEGPVADVDDARPEDAVRVDAERVLVMEAVVDEGASEVVGRADRVDVAGQVEVEVLHRDDLAVAAAGRAALDPEDRSEGRLADVQTDARWPIRFSPCARPTVVVDLPSPSGVGRDRRHDDVLAARPLRLQARRSPRA